jgi:Ribosomal protein S13/S18
LGLAVDELTCPAVVIEPVEMRIVNFTALKPSVKRARLSGHWYLERVSQGQAMKEQTHKVGACCVSEAGYRAQAVQRRTPLHIQAARVAGVEIPNQKRIEFALQYIYGVGPTTAKAILVDTVRPAFFRCSSC